MTWPILGKPIGMMLPLEWGWRFVPDARGRGYATEATIAVLALADAHDDGEMLCIIAPENHRSRRVADKVGCHWWRNYVWPGDPAGSYDLRLRSIGAGGPSLIAPMLSDPTTSTGDPALEVPSIDS